MPAAIPRLGSAVLKVDAWWVPKLIPMPMMNPISALTSMAPMTTAVEFTLRIMAELYDFMLTITRAAITPGIQPQAVRSRTIRMLPQPLSRTARGGKMMARRT